MPGLVRVGWLSAEYQFATGDVPASFLAKLEQLCKAPEMITMGFHSCEFCTRVEARANPQIGGSGEVHIPGQSGRAYATPDLVFHYVQVHGYRPPDEFIAAVLAQGAA